MSASLVPLLVPMVAVKVPLWGVPILVVVAVVVSLFTKQRARRGGHDMGTPLEIGQVGGSTEASAAFVTTYQVPSRKLPMILLGVGVVLTWMDTAQLLSRGGWTPLGMASLIALNAAALLALWTLTALARRREAVGAARLTVGVEVLALVLWTVTSWHQGGNPIAPLIALLPVSRVGHPGLCLLLWAVALGRVARVDRAIAAGVS